MARIQPAVSDRPATTDSIQAEAAAAAALVSATAHLLGSSDPELAGFFAAFTRFASPEDLRHYGPAEFAALLRAVFARVKQRKPGESLIELFSTAQEPELKRGESVLVAINDDIPFLYDSCTAEIRAQRHRIVAAFHPVVPHPEIRGTQRSVIVIALGGVLDEAACRHLSGGLVQAFADVRAAVRDWKAMLSRLQESRTDLLEHPPRVPTDERDESVGFLDWLADNNFTFLGCRDYIFSRDGEVRLDPVAESGLGVLTDPTRRVLRSGNERSDLGPVAREFLARPAPLIIAKSGIRSLVHRRVPMDYIGIKKFTPNGDLAGERRFVGLFTSVAYRKLPGEIPLLRLKTERVMAGSGLIPSSHDGKALQHILNTYPRDELLQSSEDELLATALGILNLGERPKVRLFLRFDRFDRYVSALVFIPRDRYSGSVRESVQQILLRALDGRPYSATPTLDDEALARVHYIIIRNPGPRPDVDPAQVEEEIRSAVRTWDDTFADAAVARYGDNSGAILRRYTPAFPASYRDRFDPREAVADIAHFEELVNGQTSAAGVTAQVYTSDGDSPGTLRLKLFIRGGFVPLSECLPVFENLGLKVIAEAAFALSPDTGNGAAQVSLQDFVMQTGSAVAEQLYPRLEDAFHAVWSGSAESDGFNRLVLAAELTWRDVVILRSIAKYLRQAGITFSQSYMETALVNNPAIAVMLTSLFHTEHDPELFQDPDSRTAQAKRIRAGIEDALRNVPSADEDRIIRAMQSVIDAMLRSNFFQRNDAGNSPAYLAFKLESRRVAILPTPKPLYEIFVYAPEVEGVHLRFGKIARGGIRWSDRAEDFRFEILGLSKAQQVKNAVIVPVGAKGGFYPKRIPPGAARDVVQNAGISAYRLFIGALLDLTDNISPDGKIVPPAGILRHDGNDPYFVVAADKGTATFSDIANEIAVSRGFWLGDAFASGGSEGFDHKKIGITARGAWEGIKRHFRELGRDIQNQPFTCIGVGDMSGDVFGNGMLQSKQTRLIAAFDHRHIFFDPSPNVAIAWTERKRLFDMPRSTWADYDRKLISGGGGVFARTAKTIPLSQQFRAFTGITAENATPEDVMRALLTAPVDLLYFGGIGTFIKSTRQGNADAADRANDAIRVNGRDIQALVIGEGANLGVTQYGRIEYAREGGPQHQGGRINTDAIDNSAGVDTSDHEVNIKILMSGPLRRGEISRPERLDILTRITDDVAGQVLTDNYDQTLALSVAELRAPRDLDAAGRFMRELERRDALDRTVENLPPDDELRALARDGHGLTRPQLAILLAYAKTNLFHQVSESTLPADPYFDAWLASYFPPLAAETFAGELKRHVLARAIISTQIANRTVNLAGPLFAHRMHELSHAPLWAAARGFVLADGVFGLSILKNRVCALDLKVPARLQNQIVAEIAEVLRLLGMWFIVQMPDAPIAPVVESYGAGFTALKGRFSSLISPIEKNTIEPRIAELRNAGVPLDVAEDAAILPLLRAVPEIIMLSGAQHIPVESAAVVYFAAGAAAGLDRLRALATRIAGVDHWDRLAVRRMQDDLYSSQRSMACEALAAAKGDVAAAVDQWRNMRREDIGSILNFIGDIERGGDASIAKLALANSQVQKLAAPTAKR
ncbi:MAG TPA: NAD-glutamate dehydrogenase [Micropepsaceae bacterium]|nr:NAD-glutamate dehydrogenase [Micropepsaceae bacterium]